MHKGARISLRPLQRRFKARKKPEGYTSTPTGLKRLKTQITAFHDNENGKGTPSGVPQPIHKRKLVLVKEEFDASSSGGDKRDRTADLMTASCDRFVIFSVFSSNTSVSSTKSAGFCGGFPHCVHTLSRTLGSQSGSVLCCRIFVAEQAVGRLVLLDFWEAADWGIEAVVRIVVVALADLTQ